MPIAQKNDRRSKAWMSQAECAGQDPLVYDTDDDLHVSPEIRCWLCPVRAQCLSYALAGKESGTWGGMSRKQREGIISRRRRRRTCPNPECGSTDINNDNGVGTCARCCVSWYISPISQVGEKSDPVIISSVVA